MESTCFIPFKDLSNSPLAASEPERNS
ncbi:unnamed protein product, partial [Rotaria sp. Silwood2]